MNLISHRRDNRGCRRRVLGVAICVAISLPVASGAAGSAGVPVRGIALVGGRPAANVVVWLEAGAGVGDTPARKVVLDQRNLRFEPQVLVVRAGTAVRFPNNDRVFHNVFSFHHGKVFDLGLYPVGESKVVHFDKPGVSRIFCNIHPNMAAYVVAVDSPYHAVSDAKGVFALPDVPAGRYTYRAWRAGGVDITGSWSATDGGAALVVEWDR